MLRFLCIAMMLVAVSGPEPVAPTIHRQQSGTTMRLQAVSAVDQRVVWASGLGGTFVRTTDGGATWRAGVVPGADSLEFRDVEGVSDRAAYLLAAGEGGASRIYKTEDGGRNWTLQFQNQDPKAFYDCFDFWTPEHGVAFSDAVSGRFPVLLTTDGKTWQDIGGRLAAAQENEAAFAASGSCLTAQNRGRAWVATGGAARARVLRTTDGGATWSVHPAPIISGPGAGGFTLAFRDSVHGILAGGTLDSTNARPRERVAVSSDGGETWTLASPPPFAGAVFGLSYVPGTQHTVVVTGPGGAAWSADEGKSWSSLTGVTGYWSVAFAGPNAGWLVGTEGRILKVSF